MRTTVRLDDDVAAAVNRVRRDQGLGLSEAVNQLIREGLTRARPKRTVRLEANALGLRMDVSNVAEALEAAEGPTWR